MEASITKRANITEDSCSTSNQGSKPVTSLTSGFRDFVSEEKGVATPSYPADRPIFIRLQVELFVKVKSSRDSSMVKNQ